MRNLALSVLLVASFGLTGCVASLAASAVGAAVQAARSGDDRMVTDDRRQAAITACTERAAPQGSVHIIDSEQRTDGRVTVWGTVHGPSQRRSFECIFDTSVRSFKLREIRAGGGG